jgi:transposase-like protein
MTLILGKEDLLKRVKISKEKFRLIVKCFVVDCTAIQTTKLVGINHNTGDRYFNYLRFLVVKQELKERKEVMGNGIEIDESYFGPRRQRGKKGRGARKKIIVLGLRKRNGKVYCEIIPDASRDEIMPIIKATIKSGADIYTDGWRSYDALAIYGYNQKKVNHEKSEFAKDGNIHVNGIESFWSYAKRRLNKFNGVPKKSFPFYLLESEWRFNHRDDIVKSMKKLIKYHQQTKTYSSRN